MKRNSSIELYRVLAMIGICVLHINTQTAYGCDWVARLLTPCVNAFVFISGWYGLSFSVRKLCRLWGVAVYVGFWVVLLAWMFCPERLTLPMLKYILVDQWFLVAYAMLMMISPWINFVVDHLDRKNLPLFCIPIALLLFWNFATEIFVFRHYLPRPSGFGSHTPLALGMTYIMARVCRKMNVLAFVSGGGLVGIALFSGVLIVAFPSLKFNCYASPVAILFVGSIFLLVLPLSIARWTPVCSVVMWIAPSMFTVYLLHSHEVGFDIMRQILDSVLRFGVPIELAKFIVSLGVLTSGVVIDLPRRIVFGGMKRWFKGPKGVLL